MSVTKFAWRSVGVMALLAAACGSPQSTPADGAPQSEQTAPATAPEAAAPDAASADDARASGSPAAAGAGSPAHPADASDPAPAVAAGAGAPPAAPAWIEVVLPAGTELPLRLETPLASNTSDVEDTVRATLRRDLVVDDRAVVPSGAAVIGHVTDAKRSAKVKGRARLAFRFTSLTVDDERYDVRTSPVAFEAEGTKKDDAKKIGIGAGAGAVIGAITGGGKGAAVGSAIGAGAGAGVVMATRGDEVKLAEGTRVTVKLLEPTTIRVRR